MSTSALKLVTGVIDGKSIRNSVTQASHGFVVGDVVRYDVNQDSGQGGFTSANASNSLEAEVSGIIERVVDVNTFILVYQGEINLINFTTTGSTADEVYFLSSSTPGKLESNPPNTAGHVIKPVLVRRSDNTGLVTNYIGTVIGGEATVSLDGLVPVGTIYPYAGSSSDVPNGWSICDGGTLENSRYPELYQRTSWNYGVTQKIKISKFEDGTIPTELPTVGEVVQQDIFRPGGMPGDDPTQSEFAAVAKGTVTFVDTTEGIIHVSVDVQDSNGFVSTNPLFAETNQQVIDGTDADGRPGFLKRQSGTYLVYRADSTSIQYVHKPDLKSRVAVGANHGDTTRLMSIADSLRRELYRGYDGGLAAFELIETQIPYMSGALTGTATLTGSQSINIDHGHGDDFSAQTKHSVDGSPDFYVGPQTAVGSPNYGAVHPTGTSMQSTVTISGGVSDTSGLVASVDFTQAGVDTSNLEFSIGQQSGVGLQPVNNMQPYVVTEYIIRISSEARAALVTGIDVNLSLEGLNNVTDNTPVVKEMIQYTNSLGGKYQKIQPNIDGFASKDNQDMVFHTSQSVAGVTLEHMRIDTTGKVFLGITQGNTSDIEGASKSILHQLVIKNTQNAEGAYIFLQGDRPAQSGRTGTAFGHNGKSSVISNTSAYAAGNDFQRKMGFYFLNSSGNGIQHHVIRPHSFTVGGVNPRAGCSLDVQGGNLAVAGDMYTYGATHGMFASILGVSSASGGYKFPDVSSGISGAVLMLPAGGGTLEFQPIDTDTSQWKGTVAKGISFDANVAIGTGGVNDIYGATLEVGGGAIIHGGLTIDYPLHIGNVSGHPSGGNYPFSVRGTGLQYLSVRSNDENTALVMDAYTGKDNQIWMKENGSNKAKIVWDGSEDQLEMQFYDASASANWREAFQMSSNGRLGLGTGGAVDNDYMVTIGHASSDYHVGGLLVKTPINLFSPDSHGTGGNANSPLQIQKNSGAYLQVGSASFGAQLGTFIGEGSSGRSEIWSLLTNGGTLDFYTGNASGSTLACRINGHLGVNSGLFEAFGGISGAYQGTITLGNGITSGTAVNTHDGSKTITLSAAYKLSDTTPSASDTGVAGTVWYEY